MSPRSPSAEAPRPPSRRGGVWLKDVMAGLINGVVSVPDGLAAGALAGVNPVAGLYTSAVAPLLGSLLVSAQRMQIATTSAAAIAAGQAIRAYPAPERLHAMGLLTVLTGACLALFAMLRVGQLMKYVSQSVMTGFLTGVCVVLVMDQLAPFVGYDPPRGSEPAQFWSLLTHLGDVQWPTLAVGLLALGLAVGLNRTRLRNVSSLIAVIAPTIAVVALGWDGIRQVADVSVVQGGVPFPGLPDVRLLNPELGLAAVALAAIIAIQGAGVSQSMVNLDGRPISADRDMLAQGAANVAAGVFSGIPAGGSVGQSALNVAVGAQTRWSGIFGGLWVLAILLVLATPVGFVPMAVLAALMIVAGLTAIDLGEIRSVWAVGWPARLAALITFVASLFLSLSIAILVGVLLSVLMSVMQGANDVRIKRLRQTDDGSLIEEHAPGELRPGNEVVVLDVYGSLFFAGARTLAEHLPRPAGAARPVVILRLRGHTRFGATLVAVLDDYADLLGRSGGRLYLTGLEPQVLAPLGRVSKLVDGHDPVLYAATDRLGESTRRAVEDAKAWRYASSGEGRSDDNPTPKAPPAT